MSASRLSRSTVILLTSSAGGAALSFLLSLLIGRGLGEDALGVYAAALAWVFPLSLVAEFGLGTLITRDVARSPEAAPDYLRAAALARLILGGGLTLALNAAAPLLSADATVSRGIQMAAPLVMVLPFFSLFSAIYRARQTMWPLPWLNIGMLAAQVAWTALILANGGDVLATLAINTLTSAGQLLAAWWIYRRWFHSGVTTDIRLRAAFGRMQALLRPAWPFALAAVLAALQARSSLILLERLTNTADVGYYAAAARFVEAGRVLPNALFGALLPMLATLAADPAALNRTFRWVMTGLAGFGALLALLFTLLAGPILTLTFGGAFLPAASALQVAMWALLPALLRGGRTLYWYALGEEQFTNRVTTVTLALQIGLSAALIPPLGALGAAGASLVAESAALLLLWRPFRR